MGVSVPKLLGSDGQGGCHASLTTGLLLLGPVCNVPGVFSCRCTFRGLPPTGAGVDEPLCPGHRCLIKEGRPLGNPLVKPLPCSSTRSGDLISRARTGLSVPSRGVLLCLQLVSRAVPVLSRGISVLPLLLQLLGVNGLGGLLRGCAPVPQTRGGLAVPIQHADPARIRNSSLGSLACVWSDTGSSGCLLGVP
ncbi:hypothetical protein NDU88_000020 [Pleurodeles waltl]|uniref:Uncharacterized protein n=1 Tax=Pleurodeles waltl TaxID=8319 RepID=A0AAV7VS92_PLEWA|nr:hypothetical protein NDU88_000020 [Pleurodeles waltl]